MSTPDYLICLECESPCYVFEWRDEKPVEAMCTMCGNDDPLTFVTQSDYDDLGAEAAPEE